MNLINTNTKIPSTFYVFLSEYNLVSRKNIQNTNCIASSAFFEAISETDKSFANTHLKKTISSFNPNYNKPKNFTNDYLTGDIDYLPLIPNPNTNLGLNSLFSRSITALYNTEYNAEMHRKYRHQTYPSRLSCVYAFGDYKSCIEANKKYGWDLSSVKEFKLIPHKYNKVAKVNMEIISLERMAQGQSFLDSQSIFNIWNLYWTGGGNLKLELPTLSSKKEYESEILWEYLIEGTLKLK